MKKSALLLFTVVLFFSCKQDTKTLDYKEEILDVTTSIYPENISKIFDAHGGIDKWNTFKKMYFEIEKPTINDKYDVALKSRKSLITSEHHLLGYDGENVWIKNLDTTQYKGNAKFFYNLMFYFYAMPYVLGDDGIHYQDAEAITFKGKEYPGIKISYDAGVGESSDDEYVLYYDKATNKMAWLAYTVTYFSKEKSKKFNLIKYTDWDAVNGLQLPTAIQWYVFKDGEVGEKDEDHGSMAFVNAKLFKEIQDDNMFKAPEDATLVE